MWYYFFQIGLLMLAAYLMGAIVGCLLHRLVAGGSTVEPELPGRTLTTQNGGVGAGTTAGATGFAYDPDRPMIEAAARPLPPDADPAIANRFERALNEAPNLPLPPERTVLSDIPPFPAPPPMFTPPEVYQPTPVVEEMSAPPPPPPVETVETVEVEDVTPQQQDDTREREAREAMASASAAAAAAAAATIAAGMSAAGTARTEEAVETAPEPVVVPDITPIPVVLPEPMPEPAPAPVAEASGWPLAGLVIPADGPDDDLTRIRSIGPFIEKKLNAIGITQYRQIAALRHDGVCAVSDRIGEGRRITRENWIEQAAILASGASTSFAVDRDTNAIRSSMWDLKPGDNGYTGPIFGGAAAAVVTEVVDYATSSEPAEPMSEASIADAVQEIPVPVYEPVESPAPAPNYEMPAGETQDAVEQPAEPVDTYQPVETYQEVEPAAEASVEAVPEQPGGMDSADQHSAASDGAPEAVEDVVTEAETTASEPAAVDPAPYSPVEEPTPEPQAPADPVPSIAAQAAAVAAAAAGTAAAASSVPPTQPASAGASKEPQDLKRIRGIDARTEQWLKSKGVTRYEMIGRFTPDVVKRAETIMKMPGRIAREQWIEQARVLASGGKTSFSERYDAGQHGFKAMQSTVVTQDNAPRPAAPQSEPAPPAQSAQEAPAVWISAPSIAPGRSDLAGLRSIRSEALRGPAGASGGPDDLKRIRGVGMLIEKKLNSLGVSTFEQIANWTNADIDRVSQVLDFQGRIQRENWVEQARILAAGGQTEFSRRMDRGERS